MSVKRSNSGQIMRRQKKVLCVRIAVLLALLLAIGCSAHRYQAQRSIKQLEVEILDNIETASPEALIHYYVWAYNNRSSKVIRKLALPRPDGLPDSLINWDNWQNRRIVLFIEEADIDVVDKEDLEKQFYHIKQYNVVLNSYRLFEKSQNPYIVSETGAIAKFILVRNRENGRWYIYGMGYC